MGLGRDRSERSAPGEGIRGVGRGVARDVAMGFASGPFASRDNQASNLSNRGYTQDQIRDFQSRTAATMERNRQEQAQRDRGRRDMTDNAPPITTLPVTPGPITPGPSVDNMPISPTPPQVTPEMRREALRIFESQRGAGQVPYQMLPYQQGLGSLPMQSNPNLSPAFQYAAQNYSRLGGSQRLMDRPMEMMSVAERQRINEMAQGMLPPAPQQFGPDEIAAILSRAPGKGGGMVQPQMAVGNTGGIMSMRNRFMPS